MSYAFLDGISHHANASGSGSRHYRVWVKRTLDIVVIALIAPFMLPTVFVAWALTSLTGGKGIYSQPRIGRDGRVFRCWKIRTMCPDADHKLTELIAANPKLAAEWCAKQKLENDPRVTRLGRFLRCTSIDELPQFWNVLVGEMSLIGPRPFTPCQKALYDAPDGERSYYKLCPGISGLWQVSCRNDGTFQLRVSFDETYEKNLSFWLDIKIALRTLVVVLRGTGK